MLDLIYQKAKLDDLNEIVRLLFDDDLGNQRESYGVDINQNYINAFYHIDKDPNQYLMVVFYKTKLIATCHSTLIPSLTFNGTLRMQIEAVRVDKNYRSINVGREMIQEAINWGISKGARIFQLSTNKVRKNSIAFYKKLGFRSTHEGMKLYMD